MAFCSFRAVLPTPPPLAATNIASRGPDVVGIPQKAFQTTSKIKQMKLVYSISRRDAVSCLFATLVATSTKSDPAEARSVKPETRKKIREKLDKLREKAIVPKEKTDPSPDNNEKPPATPENRLTAPVPLVKASL